MMIFQNNDKIIIIQYTELFHEGDTHSWTRDNLLASRQQRRDNVTELQGK